MKKKILFIINPYSGTKNQSSEISSLIYKTIDSNKYDIHLLQTKHAGHASSIAKEAIADQFNIIAVGGGDGTLNEVGSCLINTSVCLGIIPTGSGNGLARHLGIPLNTIEALHIINQGKIKIIDTGKVNEYSFLNVAGVGFDAHIGKLFNEKGNKRGFINYFKIIVKEIFSYKEKNYKIIIDNNEICKRAFMICAANSSQFGNNFYIAPDANISDSKLNICIVNKFPKIIFPLIALMAMFKRISISSYYENILTEDAQIITGEKTLIHVDGEPKMTGETLNICTVPSSLNVIVK